VAAATPLNSIVHQLVKKKYFDSMKMDGTTVKKKGKKKILL
jgi:hypothetical protein